MTTTHSSAQNSVLRWRGNATLEAAQPVAAQVQVLGNSRCLTWNGLSAERYRAVDWQIEELTVEDHLLSCALTERCFVERHSATGQTKIAIPRHTLTFTPAGKAFSSRIPGNHTWDIVALSPKRVQEILGEDTTDWSTAFGVVDDTLLALVTAAMAEIRSGGLSGPLFAEGLMIALSIQIAQKFGNHPPARVVAKGLRAGHLRKVTEYVQDNLARSLTIKEVAAVVGLSPAHFTRCFKQATGQTPIAFITRLRVQKAQTLIRAGRPLGAVAVDCGFSDQAHMTMVFRKILNVTPGRYAHWRIAS
jgi:AraC family transcriptional regulator